MKKRLPFFVGLAFAAVIFVLMMAFEQPLLFRAQELSLWLPTKVWFAERMSYPAGMLTYIATFLTQFLHYPWLGGLLLVFMLLMVYQLTLRIFSLSKHYAVAGLLPAALLVGCTFVVGYYIFQIKTQGYMFSAVTGFLFTLCAVRLWQVCKPAVLRWLWLAVLFAVGYPLFGFYALLAGLVVAILAVGRRDWVSIALCVAGIVAAPWAYYYCYTACRFPRMWTAGCPAFEYIKRDLLFWAPYLLLYLTPVAFAVWSLLRRDEPKQKAVCWTNAVVGVVAVLCATLFWYKDYNFHTELKMEAAMGEMQYKKVLALAKQEKKEPTRLMVMSKNLALLRLGRGGDEMYKFLDGGAKPKTPIDVRMMQVGGKMLYYNYARLNFCYRWCLEDGVEYGWKVEYLKYMAKVSILNGEYEVATKFLNTLDKTFFQHKWVERYRRYVQNPALIATDKEFAAVKEFYCFEDQLDGDNSLVEIYLLNYFAHSFGAESTPRFDEMGLMCALTLKDIPTFWQNFFRYANSHKTDRMPIHFQEAALLFGNLEPGKVDISKMPFEKSVQMKFQAFMEYAKKHAVGENAEKDPKVKQLFFERFGDTYFYFYFFIRDVKSY